MFKEEFASSTTGMETISLLLVEDNKADARLLRELLFEANEQFDVCHVDRLSDAIQILQGSTQTQVTDDSSAIAPPLGSSGQGDEKCATSPPDIVFLDLSLPDGQGLDNVRRLHAVRPEIPIVILTGQDDDTLALRAAQAGAQEYLIKGQGDGKLVSRAARYAIERAQTLRELREGEERFRLLAENVSDLVCLYDLQGLYRYVSPSVRRLLGYEPEQLVGTDPQQLIHPEDLGRIVQQHVKIFENLEPEEMTCRVRHADGTYVWLETFTRAVQEKGKVSGLQTSSRDVTERVAYEQRIREQMAELTRARTELEANQRELIEANTRLQDLATTDGLTGLKNHRTFQERLRDDWNRARRLQIPLSLLLLDVDKFKQYNDNFGHPAGDEVLRLLARVLEKTTRDTDMVARYGGEEFVAVLPNTDAAGALRWAERFRDAVAATEWPCRRMTVSIGASTSDPSIKGTQADSGDPPGLIAEADRALYKSKADGRDRVTHAYVLCHDSPDSIIAATH